MRTSWMNFTRHWFINIINFQLIKTIKLNKYRFFTNALLVNLHCLLTSILRAITQKFVYLIFQNIVCQRSKQPSRCLSTDWAFVEKRRGFDCFNLWHTTYINIIIYRRLIDRYILLITQKPHIPSVQLLHHKTGKKFYTVGTFFLYTPFCFRERRSRIII